MAAPISLRNPTLTGPEVLPFIPSGRQNVGTQIHIQVIGSIQSVHKVIARNSRCHTVFNNVHNIPIPQWELELTVAFNEPITGIFR